MTYHVQYAPRLPRGEHGPLTVENYHNYEIAKAAFQSLVAIWWAELVNDAGNVLDSREGPIRWE